MEVVNDSHTMRKPYPYRFVRPNRLDCPLITRKYGQSLKDATDIDMEYLPLLKGETVSFFKFEKLMTEHAIHSRTKTKQGYFGKDIEYSVPVAYKDVETITSKEKDENADPSMIYIMDDNMELYKLRPKYEKVRQFMEPDINLMMYGVINPETKYTTLFKNPIYGEKNMITFDFGSYKQITHIETFGRYPKWNTYKNLMKPDRTAIPYYTPKQLQKLDIGICNSTDPYYYVKKYEIQYYDVHQQWISLGIFDGNQDVMLGRMHQIDVYTRFLRVIPIEYRGKIPSMEILVFGKQQEKMDISKEDVKVIKYTVSMNTKLVPDGFGCTRTKIIYKLKKHSKTTTKQYLDEYYDDYYNDYDE